MSNSFSAGGHIYIPGFYTGQTLLKKIEAAQTVSVVPKTFLPAGTGNQLMKFRSTPATQIYSY